MQAVDFIKKSAAQNSIDLTESPSHAGSETLRNGLITKLSTESVRPCRHANKPQADGGSVDNRRAFAVYGPEDFLVFHHCCRGLANLAIARLFGHRTRVGH
ncbi:hypothetical protein [Acidovorax cavernicola]|uniref:hypothetical protein n=1 Tax=Acidovorax cavernicola TaxID=1675792 RepID=UPI00142E1633|nr:hypothetical protein [Acidovorax cavernicola]